MADPRSRRPADLAARLRAAGFVPEEEGTVLIGLAAELATAPVLPGGAVLRWVTADDDMRRIAALQSAVWGQDWSWLGENLIARIAAAPEGIAVLAAEADGDVVSAAWLAFFQPGATASPACWAGRHCRSGAAAGSTGRWSLPALSALPPAASSTCTSTPLTTVPPSCAAWDSAR